MKQLLDNILSYFLKGLRFVRLKLFFKKLADLPNENQQRTVKKSSSIAKYLNLFAQYRQKYHLHILFISLVFAFILSVFSRSEMAQLMDEKISKPLDFSTRAYLNVKPKMLKNLVAFNFDDEAVAYNKGVSIDLFKWAKIIKVLDKSGAKSIYIDKLFDLVKKGDPGYETFVNVVKSVEAKIYIGLFTKDTKFLTREKVDLSRPFFDIANHLDFNPQLSFDQQLSAIVKNSDLSPETRYVYGAKNYLLNHLSPTGHIVSLDNGFVEPIHLLPEQKIITHMMLVNETFSFEQGRLNVNEKNVPLYKGKLLINLIDVDTYYENTFNPN